MKYGLFCLIEAKTNPYLTATQMKNEWMLLSNVCEDSTVDVEDVAVDEVRCIGSQEHGGALQVLGRAPTGCWRLGNDELVKRVTAAIGLRLAQRCGLRRGDVAGPNAVALDIASRCSW